MRDGLRKQKEKKKKWCLHSVNIYLSSTLTAHHFSQSDEKFDKFAYIFPGISI